MLVTGCNDKNVSKVVKGHWCFATSTYSCPLNIARLFRWRTALCSTWYPYSFSCTQPSQSSSNLFRTSFVLLQPISTQCRCSNQTPAMLRPLHLLSRSSYRRSCCSTGQKVIGCCSTAGTRTFTHTPCWYYCTRCNTCPVTTHSMQQQQQQQQSQVHVQVQAQASSSQARPAAAASMPTTPAPTTSTTPPNQATVQSQPLPLRARIVLFLCCASPAHADGH
ncbi:hypothetical protein EV702DRAFT_208545 [Suillus placidus]|uniref:Uncharacterized protein n=1 Tax=Suillus placidus TaxID=48579 RepID=A0A9P6ZG26_9AGAM|nr:hypothetical protein EV702DRAFT_208545 [Suillus placidus]